MNEIMLSTEALSAGYDKKVIVEGVEIKAEQGKILTLIGPNGAGKSTILKTICRQLRPLGGAVYIGKDRLEELSGNQLARSVSVLLTGRIKTEYMRCIDVVETGRYPYTGNLGILSDKDRDKVKEAIRLVDAEDIAECDFDRISDGQRQRIMLAGAICREPDILILDEPTTFLDIKYKLELMNILKKLAAERHIAVIMSLHELELAQRVSDTIVCIKGNCIYRTGTPEEIFSGSCIEELYGVEKGSFCEAYGSPELGKISSQPAVFVIGGGGSGIALYRSLRRKGIAFAAGIIHENDIEYPVIRALASEFVSEKAFEAVSQEKYEKALEIMKNCGNAVCTLKDFGTMNERCRELMYKAEEMGILRGIDVYE
ncbi:MAG: ABC transporter ATP-binding protein [Ruminococcus sp.]|uniref:ABC transporter ATP-binding protein n=1 Tax=Ruminococcus sp. TaxID=41978 RepID=UPI0025FC32EA|nr:ABC transporter ATP-binding protein [Ruminococcus sp.]MCR4796044.1 ABC transporter ATP-binding protein [Ruminococcus sp.]